MPGGWAEAVRRYQRGECWWLDTAELSTQAEDEQRGRHQADAWQATVDNYVRNKLGVALTEVLDLALQLPLQHWSQSGGLCALGELESGCDLLHDLGQRRRRRPRMTVTQADKARQFRALHEAPDAFVIANVWDGGSARMMAGLRFAALATSSGASAAMLGRRDGRVTRDEALAQSRVICDATELPVSADLEKGFGDAAEIVTETIRLAAESGLVGCSIEDASGNPDAPIFEIGHATERIAAAAAAVRALPFPFTLTGRTENFLRGRLDLEDTIKRLKAYEAAGADALMAPGLPDLEAVRAVCASVGKPFNFMVGIKGKSFTVAALAAAGVKRISLATSLYRAAMTGLLGAAKEVREHGTFGYIDTSLATPDMNAFLRE